MERPLKGVKVLDLSRVLAGPHCAMILGDLGAEVIKIEKPDEGDMSRGNEPKYKGLSTYFMAHNRNKKSITLNFRKPKAKEIFLEMVKSADVIVENYRAGTMENMGLGYDVLSSVNPRIILARISGFGQSGPYSNRTCFDGAAQAMSGLVEITGEQGDSPYMAGTYVIDYTSALYSTIGILSALREAEQTGVGQVIDIALLDCAFSLLHTAVPDYKIMGEEMTRNGNSDRYMWPANIYPAMNDRWVYIHAGMEKCYKSIMEVIGHTEVLEDEKHGATRQARSSVEGKAYNDALIRDWTLTKTAEEIVDILAPLGIPCAKVNRISEIIEDPQLKHRNMLVPFLLKDGTEGILAGSVLHLSGSEFQVMLPPPELGEHTTEILNHIGYDDTEIEELRDQGII